MRENVKRKMAKYLDPPLEVPSADKYHWWFALIIDPHYVNELADSRKIHEIETVYTRTIINEMIPKFYDYIVAAELEENPYTEPPTANTANYSLYLNEETEGETITSSRGGNIFIKSIESELKVVCKTSAETTAIKMKIFSPGTKIVNFISQCCPALPPYFFQFLPSQSENERDFPLADIYSSSRRARLPVEMISSPLFINRHSRVTPPEKYIDIFEVSTDNMQYQINDMESSVDCYKKSNSED